MHCTHCGRRIFRDPAATVTTRNGALHWGPKCAAKARILRDPKRSKTTHTKPQRATDHTGQADWIDNINTPQPDLTGLEPRATP